MQVHEAIENAALDLPLLGSGPSHHAEDSGVALAAVAAEQRDQAQ